MLFHIFYVLVRLLLLVELLFFIRSAHHKPQQMDETNSLGGPPSCSIGMIGT